MTGPFVARSQVSVSVEEAFAWHLRPGAFERLAPPWERVTVALRTGGVADGGRVVLRVPAGPFTMSWVAQHGACVPPRFFEDHQVSGPFKIEYLPRPREVLIRLRSVPLGGEVFAAFVVEDVTEQRRLERERDTIHSTLIHDLRGHLGGVLGYADLLASGSLGPLSAEQVEAARTVHEVGGKMTALIESQLREYRANKSRGGAGGTLEREPLNLHAVVLSSLALARPQAARAGIELVYEQAPAGALFPDRAVAVLGDVDRLGALVDNLLSNALKYARTRVVVSLEEGSGEVALAVRDDGPGIAAAFRERVFEGGFQAPGSVAGHGLGLLSARRTAEAHGGRIRVETAAEGGAALRVVLPGLERGA